MPTRQSFAAIERDFLTAHKSYTQGNSDLELIGAIAVKSLELLAATATIMAQGELKRDGGRRKKYFVFKRKGAVSRPVLEGLFTCEPATFAREWNALKAALKPGVLALDLPQLDSTVYTLAQSFACIIDLYKPRSRKTPGTFFEDLTGTILTVLSGATREYQISVPNEEFKVPTDIVLIRAGAKSRVVIPTKITTRERIVQPFAHQRILDDLFGAGFYKTLIVCVSELQRDKQAGVNEICVPDQVGLYQKHLGKVSGMYYLDPPIRYCSTKFTCLIPVKPFSSLVNGDLAKAFGTALAATK